MRFITKREPPKHIVERQGTKRRGKEDWSNLCALGKGKVRAGRVILQDQREELGT